MQCPRCKSQMIVVEWRRVELDHCTHCAGTWFDAGELELLLAPGATRVEGSLWRILGVETPGTHARSSNVRSGGALRSAERGAGAQRPARCPRCAHRLRAVTVISPAPIEIDVCPAGDGIWFDAGEAEALARALGTRGDAPAMKLAAHLGDLFRPRKHA